MSVHDNIAADVNAKAGMPISASLMERLRKFPMYQELGFNGQLGHMKETFHGLKDFNQQMTKYSSKDFKLMLAWQLIKMIAPKNPIVQALLTVKSGLGTVGKLFNSIHNFEQVFAANPDNVEEIAKGIK